MAGSISYDDYLAHYGIKGMKWGVRRKEGPDGTVTSALKSRKKNKTADSEKAEAVRKKAKKYGKSSLTNDELKILQNRDNLERAAPSKDPKKRKSSEDASSANSLRRQAEKQGTKTLSNKELQEAINRMELEQKYKNLSNKTPISKKGSDFVKDVISDAARNVATSVVEDMMRNAGSAAGGAARRKYNARRTDRRGINSGQQAIGR